MQLSFPQKEVVAKWVSHEKGLYEDGSNSGIWNVSSTQLTFLFRATEATHNFEEPTNLAVFVRGYVQEKSLTKSMMVIYLILFEKMVDYIRADKRSILSVIMENKWSRIFEDVGKKISKRLPQRIEKNETRLFRESS